MVKLLAQTTYLISISAVMQHISSDATPLEQMEVLHEKAVDLHENLVVSGNWNTANKDGEKFTPALGDARLGTSERTCWNCGKKGCNVRNYDEAKDQNRINKNRENYNTYQGKPVPVGSKPFKKRNDSDTGTARDKSGTNYCRKV